MTISDHAARLTGWARTGHAEPDRLDADLDRAARERFSWLEVHAASFLRRHGKDPVARGLERFGARSVDLYARRRADFALGACLARAELRGAELLTLYRQGDPEERRMILAAAPMVADDDEARALLGEAHRSNDQGVFCAGMLDSDLPARVLSDSDYANAVLKCAFLDLDADRLIGIDERITPDLARMLLDFMAEREAASRPIWAPSLKLSALAPVPGVEERVLGDLWHGEDRRRLSAAIAARRLGSERAGAARAARLVVETHPKVREELAR